MRWTKNERIKIRRFLSKFLSRFFVFIIICLLIIIGWQITKLLQQGRWNSEGNQNFVVQLDKTYLLSFHQEDKILNIISLPDNLFLPVARNYGDYQLNKISLLGKLEKIGAGKLLQLTLQNNFHLPIDAYIVLKPNQSSATKRFSQGTQVERGRSWPLLLCSVLRQCETNYSIWDMLKLTNELQRLKTNQVNLISLTDSNFVFAKTLPDGTKVLKLEPSLVDDLAVRYFTDNKLLGEGIKVTVFNATDFPGAAKNVSQMLLNCGVEIVSTRDADQKVNQSSLSWQKKAGSSYTFNKIKALFNISQPLADEKIEADLNLVVGNDYIEEYYLQ